MAQSTTTLGVLTNRVLLNVGERAVREFRSPVSLLARQAIEETLRELETLDDWEWLRDEVAALSWSGAEATLPSHSRIHDVLWFDGTRKYPVRFKDRASFVSLSYSTSFTDNANRPRMWTALDDATIELNPYPTDVAGQVRLSVLLTKSITLPSTFDSTIEIPERFLFIVERGASSLLAGRHLDDNPSAQRFKQEYADAVQQVRNRERLRPTQAFNMYRRKTR